MNFSMFLPSGKQSQTQKPIKPISNLNTSQMETPSQEEEPKVNPLDEIRRQAVSMSSSGLGMSTLSLTSKPMKAQKAQAKSARKPTSKIPLTGKAAERPTKTTRAKDNGEQD